MKNLTLLLSLFIGLGVFGQANPVTFEASFSNDTIHIEAEIEKKWHLYSANLPNPDEGPLATEFTLTSDQVSIAGAISESEGVTEMDEAFGVEVIYFKDEATFHLPVSTLELEENYTAPLLISYMVCNDAQCIMFDVEVKVTF